MLFLKNRHPLKILNLNHPRYLLNCRIKDLQDRERRELLAESGLVQKTRELEN